MAGLGFGGRSAAFAAALVLALGLSSPARADPDPDYPSWDEVEAARASEAATQREIARLESSLADLERRSGEATRAAQLAAEEYLQAEQALADAAARASDLHARADAAAERAATSRARVTAVVVELSRSAGSDLSLRLFSDSVSGTDPEALLSRLGVMDRLSSVSQGLLTRALTDRNAADALAGQADAAEDARERLADEAQRAFQAAGDAAAAADARLQSAQRSSDQLYAQLALLKNSTAEVERAYYEGIAAQQPDPPVNPGNGNGNGGSGSDPGSGSPSGPPAPPSDPGSSDPPASDPPPSGPGAPDATKAAGAIAFARAQLGEPYRLGGAGPDDWDCSGLTMQAYASVGVSIGPHGSTSQYNVLQSSGRLVPVEQRVAGDLLFYATGGSTTGTKYHVTLYIGGGQMIEAPYAGVPVRIAAVRTFDLVPYAGRPT